MMTSGRRSCWARGSSPTSSAAARTRTRWPVWPASRCSAPRLGAPARRPAAGARRALAGARSHGDGPHPAADAGLSRAPLCARGRVVQHRFTAVNRSPRRLGETSDVREGSLGNASTGSARRPASSATSRPSRAPTTRSPTARSAATPTPTSTATRSRTSRRELERIGFSVWHDPVGTLIASNVAPARPAFGVGSHCDSNRNGGKYDGTLGVCTALEVCRLAAESGEGPASAADLVPRGGGLRLRPDAARLADHAAARQRGGAARDLPRRARRVVLGRRRGGGLRARALAGVDPRARRPDRLGRGAHRAGPRPAGHRHAARDRRGDRRLHPRRPALPRPGRPRGRDADGLPPRRRGVPRPRRSSSSSGWPTSSAATSSARWARSRCCRT